VEAANRSYQIRSGGQQTRGGPLDDESARGVSVPNHKTLATKEI
jgi:hypothetical protein